MEVGDRSIPTSIDVGILAYTDLHSLLIGYNTIAIGRVMPLWQMLTKWVIYKGDAMQNFLYLLDSYIIIHHISLSH